MSVILPLGQILRAEREKKGLSLSEVAEGTRVKVQVLEALEINDFRNMPATVYAKGFIKLYAEFLGLDSAPLIAQYVAQHAAAPRRPSLQTNSAARPTEPAAPPPTRPAAEDRAAARAFDWPRIKRNIGQALLRPVELAMLALDRVRVPQRRRKTTFRSATAVHETTGRLPVWQYAALAAGVLVILLLLFSGLSRYVARAHRTAPGQGAAPPTLRLAEEPPPAYLPGATP
jgi:transcriptional regulator with XRE-family HTH domain